MKIDDKNDFVYLKNRIYSVNSLAKALNCDVGLLSNLLGCQMRELYREVKIPKGENSFRICYEAKEPLKSIQEKIVKTFFNKKVLIFPSYLTGSISGCDSKTNARLHLGARIIINEDISSFFPSTNQEHVLNVWQNSFKFSKEVSILLTTLTTLDNQLPQGAATSSYLANMVFFKNEYRLARKFEQDGYVYSRYVDDICISSKKEISNKEKSELTAIIYGMMRSNGYNPNRKKHEIATSRNRMSITGLNINSGNASIGKQYRSKIRAAIHEFCKNPPITKKDFDSRFYRLLGQATHIMRFHKNVGQKLKTKLQQCKKSAQSTILQI